MPELPEVETVTRDLSRRVLNKTIHQIKVFDDRVIARLSRTVFEKTLKGKTISQIARRAKAIIITFTKGGFLVVQLKMTGHFIHSPKELSPKEDRDIKVKFTFGDRDYIYYLDQRTFGWLIYTEDLKTIPYLNTVGPEPLNGGFSVDYLQATFKSRKGPIKNILLNQQLIAGLGNIYASEILYASKINPTKPAASLKRPQLEKIYQNTRSILTEAIFRRGTSMRNYRDTDGEKGSFMEMIKVYGRDGENCPSCKTSIVRLVQAGRSTFYCPRCQK